MCACAAGTGFSRSTGSQQRSVLCHANVSLSTCICTHAHVSMPTLLHMLTLNHIVSCCVLFLPHNGGEGGEEKKKLAGSYSSAYESGERDHDHLQ
mmetsp:Transcript_39397/g.63518  ORF Transcript_39397/g.63518 Transcript_39397/m.63518 type:complete len:95 (-) Transcript_39397:804-1088(-)